MKRITFHPDDKEDSNSQSVMIYANEDQKCVELVVHTYKKGESEAIKLSPEEAVTIGKAFYKFAYSLGYKGE